MIAVIAVIAVARLAVLVFRGGAVGRRCLLCLALCAPLVAWAQTPVEVAPGVYALIGDLGDVTPGNQGVVGNAGFVVADGGVLAIDTGVSYRYGERMMAAIAAISTAPVQLVVLTDPIQEFHFGSAAFQDRGVPVLAHRDAAQLIASRCEICLSKLRKALGAEAMARSRVVVPDRLIDDSTTVRVGNREVELLYLGGGSAPGNLAVFDRRSGVLFAGGLVSIGRIPRLRDGDLRVWTDALTKLRSLPATIIVPGHGPVATPAEADRTLAYLNALEAKVTALYRQGAGLVAAVRDGDLPEFRSWSLYETFHAENVQAIYLRLESADLRRATR